MAKAVGLMHGTGSSVETEYAKRVDGVWFKRLLDRGPYGYRWSKWRRCPAPTSCTYTMEWGCSAGAVPAYAPGRVEKLRLPNG